MRHLATALLIIVSILLSLKSQGGDSPAERLAESVRFQTISFQDRSQFDAGEFRRFHAFLRESYPLVFSQLQVETVNEYSLLIRWPGSDSGLAPVLFTAHMDVVPVEAGTEGDWDYPPFDGVVANGRIYGRGTLDDKQGVLSLLEAAESLLAEQYVPARELVFAFGHDEEISGEQGAVKIAGRLKELGLHFAWMVDEGGFLISDNPLLPGRSMGIVNVAEKGYLTLTLSAVGEGGHSSRPPGISSIGRLSGALDRIEKNPFATRLVKPVEAMLQTLGPHMKQPERFAFENLWLTKSLVKNQMAEDPLTNSYVRTTTALTMFNGGVKENVVPQRAQAKVNFRLLPGDTAESVQARISDIVNDPQISITYDVWYPPSPVSDHEGEGFAVITDAVAAVYPQALVVPSLLVATTDSRHYTDVTDNQYRFHGIMVGASQANTIHGTNEYLGIESYKNAIAVARQMLWLTGR